MMRNSNSVAVLIFAAACTAAALAEDSPPVSFQKQIQPILQRHCVRCHGAAHPKAALSLATAGGFREGSEFGPIYVARKPDESRLWELVESGEMPPEEEKRLSADELSLIHRWIEQGAVFDQAETEDAPLNQHDVLPILYLRCATCHGRQVQEGNLDVRSKKSLIAGGKSGPAITVGKPDQSLIVQKIAAGHMPPKEKLAAASVKPVEPAELEKLRRWIAQGALEIPLDADFTDGQPDPLVSDDDRRFWSFQPPRSPRVPVMEGAQEKSVRENPIDAFLLQRLEPLSLKIPDTADRLTLLRRVYFDLIGLPPDPETARQFAEDPHPLAYERLVDRLLASPRYGERWGQYWLDVAGYSDSEGVQDSDLVRPNAYRYRDYVIRSLNSDKPYDRFLLEQLAGDELADYEHVPAITEELYDNLVATGFLRMTADGTFSGITGFVPDRLDVIDDQLRVLGSAVLGLTIGCARCHSHKFDPIPQRDYYRLLAVFKGALDEHDWLKPTRQEGEAGSRDRYLPYVPPAERAAWEANEKTVQGQLEALKQQLAEAKDDAERKNAIEAEIKSWEARRTPEPLVRALWDRGEPSPTYLLRRGDYRMPSRLVGPGFPSVLTDGRTPLVAEPPWPGARKTGLRLAFARWLTRPDHPLTARVFVNRVWKHHFGVGLVRTLDNFGQAGEPPTHPELLDWLATGFIDNGYSIKNLHRTIVHSAAYRAIGDFKSQHAGASEHAEIRALRSEITRLDAESLRDTLLVLAGRLDLRQFGPPDPVDARPDGLVTAAPKSGVQRRSVYVMHRRTQPLTILADFDRPAMSPNCIDRMESNVAPQALHLMNNRAVHELGIAFADRVVRDVGEDTGRQVEHIHWLAYGRAPREEETSIAVAAIDELRAAWTCHLQPTGGDMSLVTAEANRRALANYCHAVMNSAELLYVD